MSSVQPEKGSGPGSGANPRLGRPCNGTDRETAKIAVLSPSEGSQPFPRLDMSVRAQIAL